jgi:anti-sigma B factor antagonist
MLTRHDTSNPTQPTTSEFDIVRRDLDERRSVIAVEGELDLATAPRLKWMLIDSLEDEHTLLVLDLSRASFMDSTALGVLVGVSRGLGPDARLAIVCGSEDVARIFELSGMDSVFAIFPTVDQALAHVQGRTAEAS